MARKNTLRNTGGRKILQWQECCCNSYQNGRQEIRYFYFLPPDQIDAHTEDQHIAYQGKIPQSSIRHQRPQETRQGCNASLE